MWSIPVGATFEAIIDWLKDHFTFLFEAIDAVLNFTIRALEHILLLSHEPIYPSLAIALILGLLGFYLVRRHLTPKIGAIVGVTLAVAFGGLEIWRHQALEARLQPAEAKEIAAQVEAYAQSLAALAPADFSDGREFFAEARALAPEDTGYVRAVGRLERGFNRLRPGDFEDAAEYMGDLQRLYLSEEYAVDLAPDLEERIEEQEALYFALIGVEEAPRLARRFASIEEPVKRYDALNSRTYADTLAFLTASLRQAEALGASA
ncbi:MAG: hypothetical protein ACLFR7_02350, partial [Opitutales bacterium]